MAIRLYEDQTVLILYTVLPEMNAGLLKCYVMSLHKHKKMPKWSQARNKAILGSFKHKDLSVCYFEWLKYLNSSLICILIYFGNI